MIPLEGYIDLTRLDGLATEGEGSMHSELIPLSGGRNVCRLKPSSLNGQELSEREAKAVLWPR